MYGVGAKNRCQNSVTYFGANLEFRILIGSMHNYFKVHTCIFLRHWIRASTFSRSFPSIRLNSSTLSERRCGGKTGAAFTRGGMKGNGMKGGSPNGGGGAACCVLAWAPSCCCCAPSPGWACGGALLLLLLLGKKSCWKGLFGPAINGLPSANGLGPAKKF